MERYVYLILLLVLTAHQVVGPNHHHHHNNNDCGGHDCELVDAAVANIGMDFDKHLCDVFRHVNCDNHILTNDENVCGSDGRTYKTHCLFAQARCKQTEAGQPQLSATGYGNCSESSISNTASHTTSISASTVVSAHPSATAAPSSVSTSTTTTVAATVSVHHLLGSVFCQYEGSIACGQNFNVVCGSNGIFYPNKCELLKAQCSDSTLREVSDASLCSQFP